MCYSPRLIKNPNYGRKDRMSYVVDTRSHYVPVPCGHCGECLALRSASVLQRCQLEEKYGYPFFITLTYNPQSLVRHECSNGYKIAYAPISDLQNMFKRLRKSGSLTRRFRYFAVTEFGSQKSRPHVHLLLFLERFSCDSVYTPLNLEKIVYSSVLFEWRRNYAKRVCKRGKHKGELVPDSKHPDYRPLCTFVQKFRHGKLVSTYDCHYVTPSVISGTTEDVSFYVSKYLIKDSEARDKIKRGLFTHVPLEEAYEVWSKVRPRAISSLNFGFGYYGDINPKKTSKEQRLALLNGLESASIVRDCIERSSKSEKTAKFYDLQTGKPISLARYWYKFGDIYDLKHHNIFLSRQDRVDGVSVDERSFTSKLLSLQTFGRNSKDSKSTDLDLIYD